MFSRRSLCKKNRLVEIASRLTLESAYPRLHRIQSIGGHASSLCIPGLYNIQGIHRIKMADSFHIKKETAGKAEGRTTLLPMRYTYVPFFYNFNAFVSFRNSLTLSIVRFQNFSLG